MSRITWKMIDVDRSTARLLDLYGLATDQEILSGSSWYFHARDYASSLAARYDTDLATAAAVISALSPGCNWEQNLIDAAAVFDQGDQAIVSTYSRNKQKAVDLAAGLLAPDQAFKAKTGYKTLNFWKNIVSPEVAGPVTLDRHGSRAALGTDLAPGQAIKWIKTPKKYETVQSAYQAAARAAGLAPHQFQAVIWLVFRRLYGRTYNYDPAF